MVLLLYVLVFFFFFFQAEDGIRDLTVTGVQTCALPICGRGAAAALPTRAARRLLAGRAHHGALPARVALRAGVAGARDMGRPAGARLAPSAATRSVRACLDGSGLRAGREFLVSDRRRRRR